MVEFLTRIGTTAAIEKVVIEAEHWILLISPYLKLDQNIKRRLEAQRDYTDVIVVYGKKRKLDAEVDNWLKSNVWIETLFCKNLHAKCYLNEKEAIITSMNLHEFSQNNNYEMGVRVSYEEDFDIYFKVLMEAVDVTNNSETVNAGKASRLKKILEDSKKDTLLGRETVTIEHPARKQQKDSSSSKNGHCIRCKTTLDANPASPYCYTHFKSWNRYKNEHYEEKFCHLCGIEHSATMAKPVCCACYKRYVA